MGGGGRRAQRRGTGRSRDLGQVSHLRRRAVKPSSDGRYDNPPKSTGLRGYLREPRSDDSHTAGAGRHSKYLREPATVLEAARDTVLGGKAQDRIVFACRV